MAVAPGAAPAAAPVKPPNVVFLFADDFGYADLKCYGHPYALTPKLDELAFEGTRFAQFDMTGVTCCPSRTGLMTGKFLVTFRDYPARAPPSPAPALFADFSRPGLSFPSLAATLSSTPSASTTRPPGAPDVGADGVSSPG